MVHATTSPPPGGGNTNMTRSNKAAVQSYVRQLCGSSDTRMQLQAAQALGTLWLFMEGAGGRGEATGSSKVSSSSPAAGKGRGFGGGGGGSFGDVVLAAASDLGAWNALVDALNRGLDSVGTRDTYV